MSIDFAALAAEIDNDVLDRIVVALGEPECDNCGAFGFTDPAQCPGCAKIISDQEGLTS